MSDEELHRCNREGVAESATKRYLRIESSYAESQRTRVVCQRFSDTRDIAGIVLSIGIGCYESNCVRELAKGVIQARF